ncbi:MAG: hypothetical protein HQM16_10725 [Deltaproteobacteria bacterium]|nr:hypothetical protein [Deltaproteobacteria bacterium]
MTDQPPLSRVRPPRVPIEQLDDFCSEDTLEKLGVGVLDRGSIPNRVDPGDIFYNADAPLETFSLSQVFAALWQENQGKIVAYRHHEDYFLDVVRRFAHPAHVAYYQAQQADTETRDYTKFKPLFKDACKAAQTLLGGSYVQVGGEFEMTCLLAQYLPDPSAEASE